VVFGEVVAIYIDDAFVPRRPRRHRRDARVSRLGYMDYGVLEPADIFTLQRGRWPATTGSCRRRPNGTAS
jgi:hypothetical protein